MTAQPTSHPEFQKKTADWISANGEVLTLFRFSHAAGSKSFEFFDSLNDFNNRLAELPPRTSVIVFGEPQLPLRGVVRDEFVSAALECIDEGTYWLVVRLSKTTLGSQSWFHHVIDDSLEELEAELRDEYCWAEMVAVGPEPDWLHDTDTVISAVVPERDGTVRIGVY